jgi:hypothetical protein
VQAVPVAGTVYCPVCGSPNISGARFCNACGSPIALVNTEILSQTMDTQPASQNVVDVQSMQISREEPVDSAYLSQ